MVYSASADYKSRLHDCYIAACGDFRLRGGTAFYRMSQKTGGVSGSIFTVVCAVHIKKVVNVFDTAVYGISAKGYDAGIMSVFDCKSDRGDNLVVQGGGKWGGIDIEKQCCV